MERRLVAILAADIVGYSSLMADDEVGTFATLKTCEKEVIEPTVGNYNGRIIKRMGDGYLVEFISTIDCVECALAWQKQAARLSQPLKFRMGINLSDVLSESGDIYGDGVNIASRIEGLAEPGGISLSGEAYDQVKRKLPYIFNFTGEHKVKNINDPIRIYNLETISSVDVKKSDNKIHKRRKRVKRLLPALLIVFGILCAIIFYYKSKGKQDFPTTPVVSSARIGQHISKGTSIAVLPFKNLSSNKEQEYFSDGITNDIITDLSKFQDLLVISSNTVFSYKGRTLNAVEIGKELGVQYLLEGTVQKASNKIRINAQLVESTDGTHIWAERFDREYSDIFELQSEIVKSIVATLAIKVSQSERDRAMRTPPQDLDAYDYVLRGSAYYNKRTRDSNIIAKEMFTKAISIDPHYADAIVGIGLVEYAKVSYGWTEFPLRALESALNYGQKALELDRDNASAHTLLCNVYTFQNKYELALREAEQALELNPNNADVYSQMGWTLLWAGRVDDAITALKMSLRLDNTSIRNSWLHLGIAYYLKHNYAQALESLENGVIKRPDFVGYHIILAATYAQLDRLQDAKSSADDILRLDPFFRVESFGTAFKNQSHRLAIADGLRKAGLE
jgi:adenylate cyclase